MEKKPCNYLMDIETYAMKKNPCPFGYNQLNIFRAFNQNLQYPHAIDTSMTIHMQGENKIP
jgi:hypothetical protein